MSAGRIDCRSAAAAERRDAKRREWHGQWVKEACRAATALMARCPSRTDEIEKELAETLAAGPDYRRYRRGSDFEPPLKINRDRNFLAKLMFLAERIELKTRGMAHENRPGRAAVALLRALLFKIPKGKGVLTPSYEALAEAADYCRRTVITAMAKLVEWGFVTIHRRLTRKLTALGGIRVVQDTNCYDIHMPKSFIGGLAVAMFGGSSGCNGCSEASTEQENNRGQEGMRAESAAVRLRNSGLLTLRSMT